MAKLTDFTFAFDMAMTSTPKTASPTYTALASFVRAGDTVRLARGRGSEQADTAQPGRANVSLKNTDGRFTMNNGSSPYAPLKLRRPCRWRVTYSATTYDLWQGFVDDWGNGRDELTGVARLSMSDRMARAAKNGLKSNLVEEILTDSPVFYLPLTDGTAATSASDIVDGNIVIRPRQSGSRANASYTFGSAFAPGPDSETALAITAPGNLSDYVEFSGTSTKSLDAVTRTIEMFVNIPAPLANDQTLVAAGSWMNITVDSAGRLNTASQGPAAVATKITGQGWTHIMVVVSSDTVTPAIDWLVFVNGQNVTGGSDFGVSNLGTDSGIRVGTGMSGSIGHIAVHNGDLSARIDSRLQALTSWDGETTGDRFLRLCRIAGMTSGTYALSGTPDKPMSAQAIKGTSLLDAVTECAKVEGGPVFVTDTGVLTFAAAATRYNTAVGLTLDATKSGQVDPDTTIPTDDQDLINDSTATLQDGSSYRTTDATSITDYDLHDESETLYADSDATALNWTQWRVAQFKTPAPRLTEVPVNVVAYATSGGNVPNLLNADIGTKLQIINLPSDTSATSTLTLMIEGVRDDISKDSWIRTFTTSPIGLNDTGWTLGTSALGSTAKLLY